MRSRFHEAADAELREAVAYYDERAFGLGDQLLADVKTATRHIEQFPEMAPVVDEGVRSKVLTRFPYSLLYIVDQDELLIVAVAHQSRRPALWADRLPR